MVIRALLAKLLLLAVMLAVSRGQAANEPDGSGADSQSVDPTSVSREEIRQALTEPPQPTPTSPTDERPNIVFVVADDMGFSDAPWNEHHLPARLRGRVLLPTLTAMARKGVIFDQSYSQPKCTPSRAALMTGRYPMRFGLPFSNIKPSSPFGVPLSEVLMPKVMRDLGYSTHLVGKWHLGHCNISMTPLARGFDSFLGPYVGSMNYYTHTKGADGLKGYTMHYGDRPTTSFNGWYATDLFTSGARSVIHKHHQQENHQRGTAKKPLFLMLTYTAPHAPLQPHIYQRYLRKGSDFYLSEQRRLYLSLLYGLDVGVRNVVDTLQSLDMWENTLFVFTSDNGALPGKGLNYPLRGGKGKFLEGGTRVPTFAYHPAWHKTNGGHRSQALIHITDWLPTLAKIGGSDSVRRLPPRLDGVDFSAVLRAGAEYRGRSPRRALLYGALVKRHAHGFNRKGAYRVGDWKVLLKTDAEPRNFWYITEKEVGPPTAGNSSRDHDWHYFPFWREYWALFNLAADPYEEHNVLFRNLDTFNVLRQRLLRMLSDAVTPLEVIHGLSSPEADPRKRGGFWTHGYC